ncbi:MAG: hypothetical protein JSV41_12690 [Gemmatimonadota bacterium]|nr:MAG: hypothetical protein JSV41_12690 [Gemmatimonadota bacterium]
MSDKSPGSFRRKFNRYISLVASIIGMFIIMSSFLFTGDLLAWYGAVILGLVIVLVGFWYGANPILTSERRYLALRSEVDGFIGLVRRLNTLAVTGGSSEEFQQVKAAMLKSVERMAELAGKEGKPPTPSA